MSFIKFQKCNFLICNLKCNINACKNIFFVAQCSRNFETNRIKKIMYPIIVVSQKFTNISCITRNMICLLFPLRVDI